MVPFYNPDKAEEQVSYRDQQVGQWQIVGDIWKVYFVHLVEAIEKISLLQKALQVEHRGERGNQT